MLKVLWPLAHSLCACLVSGLCFLGCSGEPPISEAPGSPAEEAALAVTAPGMPGAVVAEEHASTPSPSEPVIKVVQARQIAELISAAKGKTLVVNVWATWCPPCVAEMPHFADLYRSMDLEKVALLSLSGDDRSTIDDKVRPFMEKQKLPFPVYVMEVPVDELAKTLGVEISGALPITVVYTPEGTLKKLWEEPVTLEQLKEGVAS